MAFAPSARKRNKEKNATLNINSMMDMMTIILLFLLKSMSTSGALIQPSEFVELAKSKHDQDPEKALAFLLTTDGIYEDHDGKPGNLLADANELNDQGSVVLSNMGSFLMDRKAFNEKVGKEFTGKVTIQVDRSIRYSWIQKVIATCGANEYGTIDFVIEKIST